MGMIKFDQFASLSLEMQLLALAPMISSFVKNRLMYRVVEVVEKQVAKNCGRRFNFRDKIQR
jgi:hypothetical protein